MGWLFIDDLILRFSQWKDAQSFVSLLAEVMAQGGFQFALSKCSVMSTETRLAEGRTLVCPDSALARMQWSAGAKYLRKTIQHCPTGTCQFQYLWQDACRSLRQRWEDTRAVTKHASWHTWKTAIEVFAKYLSSTWLWFSPCLELNQQQQRTVRSVQFTYLVQLLKLTLPKHLTVTQAHALCRIRRRALRV